MLNHLTETPQRAVVVGDVFVTPEIMEDALRNSKICVGGVTRLFWGTDDKDEFAKRQMNIERNGPAAEAYADGLADAIQTADIVVTHFNPLPEMLLRRAKMLKAIFTCRGGLEHIDVAYASKMNVPVVNVIRNAEPVADFTLGMIIALTRNIASSYYGVMQGRWPNTFSNSLYNTTLSQMTVGLVGLGNVGTALALRLQALQVPMIVFDEYTTPQRMEQNGLGHIPTASSMEEVFEKADVVSLHLRLTEDNAGLIDRKYFSLMKPTAYFINTARGGLVHYDDLADALEQKRIAGAALDVFDKEPLGPGNRFTKLGNVLLTPHIAGSTADSVYRSPYVLFREADKIFSRDITDRVANWDQLTI